MSEDRIAEIRAWHKHHVDLGYEPLDKVGVLLSHIDRLESLFTFEPDDALHVYANYGNPVAIQRQSDFDAMLKVRHALKSRIAALVKENEELKSRLAMLQKTQAEGA